MRSVKLTILISSPGVAMILYPIALLSTAPKVEIRLAF